MSAPSASEMRRPLRANSEARAWSRAEPSRLGPRRLPARSGRAPGCGTRSRPSAGGRWPSGCARSVPPAHISGRTCQRELASGDRRVPLAALFRRAAEEFEVRSVTPHRDMFDSPHRATAADRWRSCGVSAATGQESGDGSARLRGVLGEHTPVVWSSVLPFLPDLAWAGREGNTQPAGCAPVPLPSSSVTACAELGRATPEQPRWGADCSERRASTAR